MQQQVLGDVDLRRHVRDAGQRQHVVGLAGGQQRGRQAQRVRRHHVVVGEAVDEQQRPGQSASQREQRRSLVGLGGARPGARGSARCRRCRRGAQSNAGRPGDGGVEEVRPPSRPPVRRGSRRTTNRGSPPATRSSASVLGGDGEQGVGLVFERRGGDVEPHRSFPRRAPEARWPAAVDPRGRRTPARRTTETRCARTIDRQARGGRGDRRTGP